MGRVIFEWMLTLQYDIPHAAGWFKIQAKVRHRSHHISRWYHFRGVEVEVVRDEGTRECNEETMRALPVMLKIVLYKNHYS